MTKVLITGGTGTLGRELVPRLQTADHIVRIMSRSDNPKPGDVEWAQASLAEGTGLAAAVDGVDAIVHAASNPMGSKVDVDGTEALLRHARDAGVRHFVYISIVGIDKMQEFSYYRNKLAAEEIIKAAGVPWTILRTTQWHAFIERILTPLTRFPVAFAPKKWQFQSMDEGEVAEHMLSAVVDGPSGMLPEIGGPEVLLMGDMARARLDAMGLGRPLMNLPIRFGPAAGFKAGLNTVPENRAGKITWAEWLAKRYAAPATTKSPTRPGQRPI